MAAGPAVELPIGNRDHDLEAMFRGMYHARPVVNGHSGYIAPHYPALVGMMNAFDPRALPRLAALGVHHVRIDRRNDFEGGWERWVEESPGATLLAQAEEEALFLLPETPAPEVWPGRAAYGPALPIVGFKSTVNEHQFADTQDEDLWSRWHTFVQEPGDEIVLELDRLQPVGAIALALGPYWFDYPRDLEIDVSADGGDWTAVWAGPPTVETFDAALRDPKRLEVAFPLDGAHARFIRLRQVGRSDEYYWSIAELAVLAP
jgi:hypothetical protein